MDRKINDRDFVPKDLIETYQQIDGLYVIEELLLFRGCEIVRRDNTVLKKQLDSMALIVYGLKVNPTNKLFVEIHLDKFYLRADLSCRDGRIKVPIEIYNRVKELNDRYKRQKE